MVLDILRKMALALFVGLLSLSALVFCVAYPFYAQGLNEENVLLAVEKSGAIDQLIAHSDLGGQVSPELAKRVLGEEWLKGQVRELVHNLLAYAKGESQSIELLVDLTEPKERLRTLGQGEVTDSFPNQINLLERPGAREAVDNFRTQVQNLQTGLVVSAVVALLSLVGLVFLAKDQKSKIRLPSIGLALGGVYALTLSMQLTGAVRQQLPQEYQEAAFAVIGLLSDSITVFAAALIVIGVLGFAASHWFVKNGSATAGK